MSDYADKVRSLQFKKGKTVKVHTVRHEGEPDRPSRRADRTGEIAGVHLVHEDGHQDAIVGGHPDDADYLYWLTNVKGKDDA